MTSFNYVVNTDDNRSYNDHYDQRRCPLAWFRGRHSHEPALQSLAAPDAILMDVRIATGALKTNVLVYHLIQSAVMMDMLRVYIPRFASEVFMSNILHRSSPISRYLGPTYEYLLLLYIALRPETLLTPFMWPGGDSNVVLVTSIMNGELQDGGLMNYVWKEPLAGGRKGEPFQDMCVRLVRRRLSIE
jgi:hypothetical protein